MAYLSQTGRRAVAIAGGGRLTARLLLALLALLPLRAEFADLKGLKVYYETTGRGQRNVVLIHGWTCDSTFWRLQTPEIVKDYRVLLVDLPGHGKSGKPEVDYTVDLFARGVEVAMRRAGMSKAVLVGHSMGVPVVRQFLRLYPEKAAGFVAVDGRFARLPATEAERQKQAEGFKVFVDQYRDPGYKTALGKAVDRMLGPGVPESIAKEIHAKMASTPQHVMVSAMSGMADWKYGAPDPIDVPVLAVVARSSGFKPEDEAFIRTFVPKLDFRTWDGVGHFLMMEKPAEFNRVLRDFLATVYIR